MLQQELWNKTRVGNVGGKEMLKKKMLGENGERNGEYKIKSYPV